MFVTDTKALSQPTHEQHSCIALPQEFKIYCDKYRLTYSEFYIGHRKGQRLHRIRGGYRLWFRSTIDLHQGAGSDAPSLGGALIKSRSVELTISGKTHTMHLKSIWSDDHRFEFPLERGTQQFEWRRSKGAEVASLKGQGSGGWVLVRVDGELEEPVAAYSLDMLHLKLSGKFAFFDSGRTSEMGADWVVMAVLTALSLGQMKRDATTAAVV